MIRHKFLLLAVLNLSLSLTTPVNADAVFLSEKTIAPLEGLFIAPRIVGGFDAEDGPYRWTVSLQDRQGRHFCGGSLIHSAWVLTAAHCVEGSINGMRVVTGRNNLNSTSGNIYKVTQVILHPNYNPYTTANDIALLKLNSNTAENVPVIPLATSQIMATSGMPGDISRVLGWGALRENGPASSRLQRVDVPIISNTECNKAYNGDVTQNMLCAGFAAGKQDACSGDSGGPLVIKHGNKFALAGIVSWGRGCARPNSPGVYTRVAKYIGFIKQHVNLGDNLDDGEPTNNEPTNNALKNGVEKANLSGRADEALQFTVKIPQGASNLNFKMYGGQGDADLYINFNAPASPDAFVCRPYIGGNEERCLIANPTAGTYHVMVRGYDDFSGVALMATFDADTNANEPFSKLNERNLSAQQDDWLLFSIQVGDGARRLVVKIDGGSGDADLYVRFGRRPTKQRYDCRPYKDGSTENCSIASPEPGLWFIRIRGYRNFSGLDLEASVQ